MRGANAPFIIGISMGSVSMTTGVSIGVANATTTGYLSAFDWARFNSGGGGGGGSAPNTEIVYGTGTGFASSPNFEFDSATRVAEIATSANGQGFKVSGNPNYTLMMTRSGLRVTAIATEYYLDVQFPTPSTVKSINFPDANGTIALTSDIPAPQGLNSVLIQGNSSTNYIDVGGIFTPWINQTSNGGTVNSIAFDSSTQADFCLRWLDTYTGFVCLGLTAQGHILIEKSFIISNLYTKAICRCSDLGDNIVDMGVDGVAYKLTNNRSGIIQVTTSPYYATLNDELLLCDCAAAFGVIQVYLPNASESGNDITIKKIDTGGSVVDIFPISGNIDGAGSYTLTSPNEFVRLRSDGTNWWLIARG